MKNSMKDSMKNVQAKFDNKSIDYESEYGDESDEIMNFKKPAARNKSPSSDNG